MRIKTEKGPGETNVYAVSELPEDWIKICFYKGQFKDVKGKRLRSQDEVKEALTQSGEVKFTPGNILQYLIRGARS